ncbi:site-specific integrase [Photobacterium sp. J15]|uniref:site-specific integrase n=1 Tax=Photobacterium sp. J15 TaxID=265901 RepID=UPI0007E48567|nr:site-specific integrase [Photobacterium sp. J15]
MISFYGSFHLQWVKTEEFPDRKFPVVFTPSGRVNYSLLVYAKNEYQLNHGKRTALVPVIEVVSDVLAFFEFQPARQSEWLDNPTRLLYDCFEARLNGTIVNGKCIAGGLYWRPKRFDVIKRMINHYVKFEKFASTYLGAPLTSIDEQMLSSAKGSRKADPKHHGLLSHLDASGGCGGEEAAAASYKTTTPANYGEEGSSSTKSKVTKYFPPNQLSHFIKTQLDVNYAATYMLQSFTALRGSEALHILVSDVVPSDDGLGDIIFSDDQVNGKTLDPKTNKLVKRKDFIANIDQVNYSTKDLSDGDIEFLENMKPRILIDDPNEKTVLGEKGVTLQVCHPKYGYVLSWCNDYARLYFFSELLPKLLKQDRRGGHPWLICNKYGMPMNLEAYRKHVYRRTERELGVRYGPHSFRHFNGFYCNNALGMSQEDIKVNMRHASITSTDRYSQKTDAAFRAAISRREYTEFKYLTFEDLFDDA